MRRQLRRFVVPSVLLGLACLPVGAAQSPDLAVNHWTRAAEMVTARAAACSALLPDGRLLLAGGEDQAGASRSAELLGANGVFASIAPMSIARAGAACVALQDGRVLVSGGSDGISALRSIEIYDPAKNTWTSAGAMSVPRSGHAATLLPWGSVLLVGGDESGMVEAFNPIRGDVQVGGRLSSARRNFAVVTLRDGKVMIAGGSGAGSALDSVDFYDTAKGSLAPGGFMRTARSKFAAAPLPDGTVLIAGGVDAQGAELASTEIFDPGTGRSAVGPDLFQARSGHQAYSLPDNGSVLIAGGSSSGAPVSSTGIYTPWDAKAAPGRPMTDPRTAPASALRGAGALLVAGGRNSLGLLSSTEVFRFATISADKRRYAAGETAAFSGAGWKPGEQVLLQVAGFPGDEGRVEFSGAAVADSAGRISLAGLQVDRSHLGRQFLLTATGTESRAQTQFGGGDSTTVNIGVLSPATATTPWSAALDVQVTGSVSNTAAPAQVPTGTGKITFFADSGTHYAADLNAGGTFTLHFNAATEVLSPGVHTINVQYAGGACGTDTCDPSPIAQVNYTVNPPVTKFTPVFHLSVSPEPSAYAQPAAINVTADRTNGVYPTGKVTFNISGTYMGSAVLTNGVASLPFAFFTVAPFPPGISVGIDYDGDANFGLQYYDGGVAGNPVFHEVTKANTTTSVTSTPAGPVAYGSPVAYKATVAAYGTVNAGFVAFKDNGAVIANCSAATVSAGTAQCTPATAPGIGTHAITAEYAAAWFFSDSTSAGYSLSVRGPVAIGAVSSSAGAAYAYGTATTLSVTVTHPASPAFEANTVQFFDGPASLGAVTPNSVTGVAALSVVLGVGSHNVTARFTGDANYDLSPVSAGLGIVVGKANPTLRLDFPFGSPATGAPVTLRVQVVAAVSGGGVPTGTVIATEAGAQIAGPAVVDATGAATLTIPNPAPGPHVIAVSYSGDGNFNAAVSDPLNLGAGSRSTATLLGALPAGPTFGQAITLTATVCLPDSDAAGSPCYGAPQLANGSAVIRFFDGTTPIGTSRIDPVTGGASVRVNLISPDGVNSPVVGSHGISAAYSTPALEYANSASAVAVMSVGKAPTATSFATGASAWVFGQPVSLAARVTSPGVLGQAPLGTVEFLDNGVAIGRGSLTADAGGPIAQLILVAGASPLTAGTHLLSARYIGDDANYAPSQSPGLPQTVVVGKADTTTLLSWQIDSSVPGVRAILTAMVSVNPPGGGLPTGSVQFVNGETGLGSSPLVCAAGSSGATVCTAALTAALSPLGDAFQVSAVYTGDSSYNGSSSNALTITSMFAGQLAVTNAASYAGQPFAPGQIANVWGKGIRLADAADSPEKLPLPTVLRGTTVRITDSVGVERLAPLFYVSPTQVNILIPDEAALGLATLKLTSGAGDSASVGAWIGPTAPGLFSANASGEGAAAAQAVLTHADGRQEFLPNLAAWDPATNRYVAAPVSMGSATDVFTLVLYGTGIRGRSSPQKVSVLINGQALPVRYAGAQPTFVGLDQVNVDLPLSLANADLLNVSLTVDGHASNTVTVRVKP